MQLNNTTALVTGGAKRIGKNIALELAKKGTNIIVHYGKSKQAAQKTVQSLKDFGVEAIKISADLNSISNIKDLFTLIEDSFDSLDLIINNAATFQKQPLSKISVNDWDKSLNVNLRAPFFIVQNALPLLKKTTSDKLVVNIADLSGLYTWKGYIQHGVSKAGLIHLSQILARELAPLIRVNCIVPGPILPPSDLSEKNEIWENMINNIPLKKSGTPEAITSSIIFLAQNKFVTGNIIPIDGGEHLMGPINH